MTVTYGNSSSTGRARTTLPVAENNRAGRAMSSTTTTPRQATTVRTMLDVFQALLLSAQHPGITEVVPYGPGVGGNEGIKARFTWDGNKYLWAFLLGNDLNPDGKPIDRKPQPKPFPDNCPWAPAPDRAGDRWLVTDYVLKLVHDLCDTARPDLFTGWQPVGLQNVGDGHGPSGLLVTTAGGPAQVLRVTTGSGPNRDPEDDPWPGYTIPREEIGTWKEQLRDIRKARETL